MFIVEAFNFLLQHLGMLDDLCMGAFLNTRPDGPPRICLHVVSSVNIATALSMLPVTNLKVCNIYGPNIKFTRRYYFNKSKVSHAIL